MHVGALSGEQVGERVTDRHPAAAAGMEWPGRVRRDELEVDAPSRERVAAAERVSSVHDGPQHVVQPRGCQVEVDEARPGDLDALDVRGQIGFEQCDEPGRDFTRLLADVLGDRQRDRRAPVAVLALLRRLERDPTGRLGEAGLGERGAKRGDELFADHERWARRRRSPRCIVLADPGATPGAFRRTCAASLRGESRSRETR